MTVELAKAAGGRVDPNSLAHDMVMTLFGGMSKGEQSRIRMRVRTAMAEQATHGRFLGGRPPYGYTLADASPSRTRARGAGVPGCTSSPDPVAAPIVQRIFRMLTVEELGPIRIARQLTDEGIIRARPPTSTRRWRPWPRQRSATRR